MAMRRVASAVSAVAGRSLLRGAVARGSSGVWRAHTHSAHPTAGAAAFHSTRAAAATSSLHTAAPWSWVGGSAAGRPARGLPATFAAASPHRRGFATLKPHFDDVALPSSSFTAYVLDDCAAKYGDKPAFVDGVTGSSISYAELPSRVEAARAHLVDGCGFNAGDVVGVHLPNCPEYGVAFHAVAAAGGACTTSNPLYTAEELRHQLRDSGARFLLTSRMFHDTAVAAAEGTGVEAVWCVEEEGCFVQQRGTATQVSCAEVDPASATLVLPYSSGTTGLPKGVVLSHGNVSANIAQIVDHPECNLGLSSGDVMLGVLPFFHIYGMVVIMNAALRVGATVVTLPKFDPALFLSTLQQHKVTFAPLVPPIVLFLAKHPLVADYDLSALTTIFSGAAPLDAELQAAACARLPGVSVRQGYGMTEMSPVSTLNPPHSVVTGSAGMLVPNAEARVVDPDTLEDVASDGEARGELWVRGPHIMRGYLNNPEATASTVTQDGWLRSGDIACYDGSSGHFFVVDRLKELIKVKGYQVAPAELEGLLLEHPDVADAAVLGVPDERSGEVPKAFVVRRAGVEETALDAAAVKAHVAARVAEFKQLGEVVFVEAIPKSASGKILKRLLA